jgi:hypothetical protein
MSRRMKFLLWIAAITPIVAVIALFGIIVWANHSVINVDQSPHPPR